jgi:hypothetical protein
MNMSADNYSQQKPNGFLDKLTLKKRLQMLKIFLAEFPDETIQQVLDVGVTADKNALSSNYFEIHYPRKDKIIALSNQDAAFLETLYPGLEFHQGDAKQLPFADDSIDVVFSSAVIEHVGSLANQTKMIEECIRVAKKGVFITTPNRWHPIETHTLLPLIHWLPKSLHRKLLHLFGFSFYAKEENLNLLDTHALRTICQTQPIRDFQIKSISTFGFSSNLVLIIKL